MSPTPLPSPLPRLSIGDWQFIAERHELVRGTELVRLPRQQSLLLLRLAQSAGQVLPRQTLLDEVWSRRVVEDDVLSRAIAELRRVLGDNPKQPAYIETIPKSGYRLCAVVRALDPASDGDDPGPPARPERRPWALVGAALLATTAAVLLLRPSAGARSAGVAEFAAARPLTSGTGLENRPALSADGRWLAYLEQRDLDDYGHLVLQGRDGGEREVIDDRGLDNDAPALSADGTLLAWLHLDADGCHLLLRDLRGRTTREIGACARQPRSAPLFIDDARRLIYTAPPATDAEAAGLWQVDLADGARRQLTHPPRAGGPDSDPELRPGGDEISFSRGLEGEQVLLAVRRDDSRLISLVADANRLQGHAWSDHDHLILASDTLGFRALLALDLPRRGQVLLGARGGAWPRRARDGSVVFEQSSIDANIWRVGIDGNPAAAARVIASSRYDASPALSPDGTLLAYVSTRNDYEQVWLADADGRNERLLDLSGEVRWTRPSFLPDGQGLLLTCYDRASRTRLYRYRLADGRLDELPGVGAMAGSAAADEAGRYVYFVRRDPSGPHLMRAPLADGATAAGSPSVTAEVVAGTEGIDQYRVAADRLVYSRIGERGIVVRDLASGAEHTLLADVALVSRFAWAVAGSRLYADAFIDRHWTVVSLDLGGSGERRVEAADVVADAVGPALAVSADGRWLYYARTDAISMDLYRTPAP
jgi:DNA-binding winged helix-turn-helix (wHTH) protein/Tol biopolymer transport system component